MTIQGKGQEEPIRPNYITLEEIKNACETSTGNPTDLRLCMIQEEFRQGFKMWEHHKSHKKSVTFWGSARLPEHNKHYQKARALAARISNELGWAVLSGGGPGIMEAANRGAKEAGNQHSIGLTIKLPFEQHTNEYVTEEMPFNFFFSRKVLMAYSAEAYLYFPGGFGTLDELFEILTLVQTQKTNKLPIILVGSAFWNPLQDFIKKVLLEENETISPEDMDLYKIMDDEDEIMETLKNTEERKDKHQVKYRDEH